MDDKVLFFGYGANRSRSKITQIIGHDPGEAVGAIVEDFKLGIQVVNQVPQQLQEILTSVYGHQFKAYTLTPGEGIVAGVIWAFNKEDLEKLKEWEFIGVWREIVEVRATIFDNTTVKVLTEKSMNQFPITETVDGLLYDEFNFTNLGYKSSADKEYYTKQQLEQINRWIQQQVELSKRQKIQKQIENVEEKNIPEIKEFKVGE